MQAVSVTVDGMTKMQIQGKMQTADYTLLCILHLVQTNIDGIL